MKNAAGWDEKTEKPLNRVRFRGFCCVCMAYKSFLKIKMKVGIVFVAFSSMLCYNETVISGRTLVRWKRNEWTGSLARPPGMSRA